MSQMSAQKEERKSPGRKEEPKPAGAEVKISRLFWARSKAASAELGSGEDWLWKSIRLITDFESTGESTVQLWRSQGARENKTPSFRKLSRSSGQTDWRKDRWQAIHSSEGSRN